MADRTAPWRRFLRHRRIPFVAQCEIADCGAACLAMVLGYFGRTAPVREVREAVGVGQGGVTARAIMNAARSFGLCPRGVRLELDQLEQLPRASILHWGFCHFVVFLRRTRRGVWIVDPNVGKRWVSIAAFGERFTGVALAFDAGENFRTGGGRDSGLRRYLREFLRFRGVLVRILVVSALIQLFALALPLLTGALVDRVVPRHDLDLLRLLGIGLAAVVAFQILAAVVRSYLLLYLQTTLDSRLSVAFVEHLARLPYAFFLERTSGDLIVRYSSNQRIRQALAGASVSTIFDGSLVALYSILVFVVSPPIGLLVLMLGLTQIAIYVATRRRIRDLTSEDLEAQSAAQGELLQMLEGMETLKSLGAERGAVESWSGRFVDQLNVSVSRGRLDAWVLAIRGGIDTASPLLILLAGGFLVIQQQLSLGSMLAINALAVGVLGPLARLVTTAVDIQEARSHADRVHDVMTHQSEQAHGAGYAVSRLSGELRLDRASFRYGSNGPWVLRDVSLAIPAGRKVAIVGRSGAGKSTLARLMVGLYRPQTGRMLYDDHDLGQLDLVSLRRRIGIVPQRARLFATSVRRNIALARPDATLEQVIAAARSAQIHDEVTAFPLAYETHLAEGGASLSGGQRQRVALARALIGDPAILLLDEATNELDAVTESRIMATLDALRCTRIVIAHRLSTVVDADQIVVLDGGRIVASGTHQQLLGSCDVYAGLIEAQAEIV